MSIFSKKISTYINNSNKKCIGKKIWIYLLFLLVFFLIVAINNAGRITPEERINSDSISFVNAIEQYFYKNNRLPVNFNEIPIYEHIIRKYSVEISHSIENNHMTIEIYWPSHMLRSTITIKINSGNFVYECMTTSGRSP